MDETENYLKKPLENIYLSIPIDRSLTSRRRKFILSRNVQSENVHKMFQRAKFKLKCVLYWSAIIKQIRNYGTGSSLFDGNKAYKANLAEIMRQKVIKHAVSRENILEVSRKWIIFPHFFCFKIWNLVLCLALLYTCTVMPWVLAFDVDSKSSPWLDIDILIDSIFFIDILVTANLAFRDKKRKLVYKRREILKNYAKGMLVFDILAIIPFNYLTNSSHRINTYLKILRLTRLLRLFKAFKFNKILESLTGGKEAAYMAVNRLIICLVLISLLIHFTSCIWNFSVRLDDYGPDTWIVTKHNLDKSNAELYFDGVYFAVSTIFTVGFGDYSVKTQLEKIICILLELIGIGFYSFVLGVVTSLLTSIDHKEILLTTKLNMMSLFCKDTVLPKSIHKLTISELRRHFENRSLNDSERKNILSIIPKKTRAKVVSSMHQGRVFQIFFFRTQEKCFLSACVPRLNFQEYRTREVVFSQGDYPESMYFLLSGRVSFVFDQRNFVFKTMISGSYFGEIGLLEKKTRDFGAVTCCPCEVLEMTGEVLKEISEQFPSVFGLINNVAKQRNLKNLQGRDDIINLFEIVNIQKVKTYDQLAGSSILISPGSKVVYPGDWFDYKHNLELQNKVLCHELAVIPN